MQHASKRIPAVKALFTAINRVLGIMPGLKMVFIRKNSELEKSIAGFRILLCEAHKEPSKCKQLVTRDLHFIGIMGAAKEGGGELL